MKKIVKNLCELIEIEVQNYMHIYDKESSNFELINLNGDILGTINFKGTINHFAPKYSFTYDEEPEQEDSRYIIESISFNSVTTYDVKRSNLDKAVNDFFNLKY